MPFFLLYEGTRGQPISLKCPKYATIIARFYDLDLTLEVLIMRLAVMDDLPRLLEIKADAVAYMTSQNNDQWNEDYPTVEGYMDFIESGYMHVLEEEGVIIGMVGLVDEQDEEYKTMPWSSTGKELVVHRLAIAKEVYGRGYAKFLLSYAIDVAKKTNVAIIKLDTYTKNKTAQKLFLDMGFTYVGDIHFPQSPLEYHCYEMTI